MSAQDILQHLKSRDWSAAQAATHAVLSAKLSERVQQEAVSIGAGLLTGNCLTSSADDDRRVANGGACPSCKGDGGTRQIGDKGVYVKKCPTCNGTGKPLDEAWPNDLESDIYRKQVRHRCKACGNIWHGPTDDIECTKCHTLEYDNNVNSYSEEALPHHEVQRVFDETGSVGETELLCGISDLKVTGSGEVVSFVAEGWRQDIRKVNTTGNFFPIPDDPFSRKTIPGKNETAEASTLQFPPGRWPETCRHKGMTYEFQGFTRGSDGSIESAKYTAGNGYNLTVFND
jgi:hypothetical protein